jgi:hypothetical protein
MASSGFRLNAANKASLRLYVVKLTTPQRAYTGGSQKTIHSIGCDVVLIRGLLFISLEQFDQFVELFPLIFLFAALDRLSNAMVCVVLQNFRFDLI